MFLFKKQTSKAKKVSPVKTKSKTASTESSGIIYPDHTRKFLNQVQQGNFTEALKIPGWQNLVHIQDKSGNTILHWAVIFGNKEVVKQLVAAGASPEHKNQDGLSAYSIAVDAKLDALVNLLDCPTHREKQMYALLEKKEFKAATSLLCRGINYEKIVTGTKQTPLILAISNSQLDFAKKCLECGASIATVDSEHSDSPLSWAIFYNNEKMLKLLISFGADPKQDPTAMRDALHYAYPNMLKCLLRYGASLPKAIADGNLSDIVKYVGKFFKMKDKDRWPDYSATLSQVLQQVKHINCDESMIWTLVGTANHLMINAMIKAGIKIPALKHRPVQELLASVGSELGEYAPHLAQRKSNTMQAILRYLYRDTALSQPASEPPVASAPSAMFQASNRGPTVELVSRLPSLASEGMAASMSESKRRLLPS